MGHRVHTAGRNATMGITIGIPTSATVYALLPSAVFLHNSELHTGWIHPDIAPTRAAA